MTTGAIPVSPRTRLKVSTSSPVNSFAFQPRGLREKICTVSQRSDFALSKAFCKPPAIGAWKPMRGVCCACAREISP
ncbi:MAG: hypothetical protein LC803_08540 [Acidobacteria bacterium]|nr:hypothetical protein [Acidobacteriota bacterium]